MKTIAEYKQMLVAEGLLASDNAETADFSQEVTDVSYNSLTVKPGTLFLCKGANFKEAYLADALAKGACGYVAARDMNMGPDVPCLVTGTSAPPFRRFPPFILIAAGTRG